jgi:chromosome segregation ATPase
MNNSKNDSSNVSVSENMEKNMQAIKKLKNELSVLEKKIQEGEERLSEAKELMDQYESVTEQVMNLNDKMQSSRNVPVNVSEKFEQLVSKAETLEKKLYHMGIRSENDYLKMEKSIKDKRQLLDKYTEMITQIEQQNQHQEKLVKQRIQTDKDHEKELLKEMLEKLNHQYGIVMNNFQDLVMEMKKTEQKIKAVITSQKISKESYEKLREVEKYVEDYENSFHKLDDLKEKYLDSSGYLKDPHQKDTYFDEKYKLDSNLRFYYDYLYKNNIFSKDDFYLRDRNSKEEIQQIEEDLRKLDGKMNILMQIQNQSKKIKS